MDEQAPVVLALSAERAWLYHTNGMFDGVRLFPEIHTTDLPPSVDWCVTHRPAPRCPCGLYEIRWMTEDEAA